MSSFHSTLAGNWTAVSNQSTAAGPLASAARAWLGDYEGPVLRAVESAGPAVSTWLETRLDAIAEANNLTEVRLGITFTRLAWHRCRQGAAPAATASEHERVVPYPALRKGRCRDAT